MAYAGARFAFSVSDFNPDNFTTFLSLTVSSQMLRALKGETEVVECSFVKSNLTEAAYFATPLRLGVSCYRLLLDSFITPACPQPSGVAENLGIGQLSEFEQAQLAKVGVPLSNKIIMRWCTLLFPRLFQS